MIKPGEIQKKAREIGVRDQQIEKDYVLSWILKGISSHSYLSKLIVFKGGTVLKKVYFDSYRFSEDLDFTLLNSDVSNEQIYGWFTESFDYVRDEANIPLNIIDNNEHEDSGINFYISYLGPFGGQGNNKKVKIDISRSENLEFTPELRHLILNYSDLTPYQLLCNSLEEVLIEKLRSIMQRMQARYFYDIWYLTEKHGMDVNFIKNEFINKCKSKSLNSNDLKNKLLERIPQYRGRWEKSMSEQIHELPDFEQVERETMRQLKKIL